MLHKMSNLKIPSLSSKPETLETCIIDNEENACMGLDAFTANNSPVIILSDTDDDNQEEYLPRSFREKITAGDLSIISKNRMLTDNTIQVFQEMIKSKYPTVDGLQDPVLGQTLNFKVFKSMPFVQILHDGNIHWVTISKYGCKKGEVNLLDSMFSGSIAIHTKRQICAILHCDEPTLTINVVATQQQSNGVDCGVYAIAYAQCIAAKQDPSATTFIQASMRNTLLASLKDDAIKYFKAATSSVRRCKSKEIKFDIYCTCRMFWTKSDKWVYGK